MLLKVTNYLNEFSSLSRNAKMTQLYDYLYSLRTDVAQMGGSMPADPPSASPAPARLQSEFMPRVWKSQRRKGAAEAVAV